jgi:hypothetical protein
MSRASTRFALNIAAAAALVLYDRLLQYARFAGRPIGSGGRGDARDRADLPWCTPLPPDHAQRDGD